MDSRSVLEGHKKFMYVKQELLQSLKENQSKMLINPNFVNPTLIKPHFNKHFLANQTIHVNPNVIRNHEELAIKQQVVVNHTIREALPTRNNIIVSTPTKIVRVLKREDEGARTRRISIHTKYKIIRNSNLKMSQSPLKVKSRFTIDRRLDTKKKSPSKCSDVYMKHMVKLNSSRYVRINNITNKKGSEAKSSSTKLNRKIDRGALKLKMLTIRGQKYKMDSSHRTLTLIQNKCDNQKSMFKTIYVGGMTFKQKEPNVFVKTKVRQQHIMLRQAKQRSINTLTNKLKKSNIPCPLYHKFGKCKGRETGKCIRLHNPEQISLCAKFIQGACTKSNCLLSHKISAEKMPTCKFFLEGLCSKDDCPYLHVKISSKADICKDFLEGFCKKAAECEKRHQYLCSDFERTGRCVKKNCQYPHGSVVRPPKFTNLIIEKLQGGSKQKINRLKPTIAKEDFDEKTPNIRYYKESQSTKSDSAVDNKQNNSDSSHEVNKRPKLGSLPSFIPFVDSSES
ncbi:hypothetical protein RN001_009771 [Aquatica leii]|uniref:Zinc finger CCCH domain-containing protein 3 n=1 Tax=Aquatica leii TaxID=1421715 RepID=A0AAN7Q2Q7_9COLE|nr:hypothetical protein RN001_009771 [Aquatica leii]